MKLKANWDDMIDPASKWKLSENISDNDLFNSKEIIDLANKLIKKENELKAREEALRKATEDFKQRVSDYEDETGEKADILDLIG
jgi:DNA-binding protein H-NS